MTSSSDLSLSLSPLSLSLSLSLSPLDYIHSLRGTFFLSSCSEESKANGFTSTGRSQKYVPSKSTFLQNPSLPPPPRSLRDKFRNYLPPSLSFVSLSTKKETAENRSITPPGPRRTFNPIIGKRKKALFSLSLSLSQTKRDYPLCCYCTTSTRQTTTLEASPLSPLSSLLPLSSPSVYSSVVVRWQIDCKKASLPGTATRPREGLVYYPFRFGRGDSLPP